MPIRARKDTVRRLALTRRSRLSAAERETRGAEISRRVLDVPEVRDAERVLAFVSIRSEVPTRPLLEAILSRGATLLLPYVSDDGALRAAAVGSLDELEPGYRGIPEPRARIPVDPTSAQVVLIPGVAFDTHGGRVGYGGGFYDAFLRAAAGVPRVGMCFEVQLVDAVPREGHDERVDILVTEEQTIRCR